MKQTVTFGHPTWFISWTGTNNKHASRSRDWKINSTSTFFIPSHISSRASLDGDSTSTLSTDRPAMLSLSDWITALTLVFGGCCRYARPAMLSQRLISFIAMQSPQSGLRPRILARAFSSHSCSSSSSPCTHSQDSSHGPGRRGFPD